LPGTFGKGRESITSTLLSDEPEALSAHSGAGIADIASVAIGSVRVIATAQAKPVTTTKDRRRQFCSASGDIISNVAVIQHLLFDLK
jgi:hypothetical protein